MYIRRKPIIVGPPAAEKPIRDNLKLLLFVLAIFGAGIALATEPIDEGPEGVDPTGVLKHNILEDGSTPFSASITDGADPIGHVQISSAEFTMNVEASPDSNFVPGYGECDSVMRRRCEVRCEDRAATQNASTIVLRATCRMAWQVGYLQFACSCDFYEFAPGQSPQKEPCVRCTGGLSGQ